MVLFHTIYLVLLFNVGPQDFARVIFEAFHLQQPTVIRKLTGPK